MNYNKRERWPWAWEDEDDGDPGNFLFNYFDKDYKKRYCQRVEIKDFEGGGEKEEVIEPKEEQEKGGGDKEDWDDPLPEDWEIVQEEYKTGDLDPCDVEARSRQEYEMWELEQIRDYEEWEFERSALEMEKRFKNMKRNRVIITNVKRPKEETGREKWIRWQDEKEVKENKKVIRMAKKMKREGKIKGIDSYFNN
jgi:hypothetical protein